MKQQIINRLNEALVIIDVEQKANRNFSLAISNACYNRDLARKLLNALDKLEQEATLFKD